MIQIASLKDLEKLIKVCSDYKNNFNRLYDLNTLLTSNMHQIFIYKEKDMIIGFIILEITYETLSILHLYVKPEHRRKNIASLMLDYAISECDKAENIILEVRVDNIAAINLYKKFDFKIINIRKKYYNGIDGYVMERKMNFE